jgi:hypothetical protein
MMGGMDVGMCIIVRHDSIYDSIYDLMCYIPDL